MVRLELLALLGNFEGLRHYTGVVKKLAGPGSGI